jgi:Uma2 family endonuclease
MVTHMESWLPRHRITVDEYYRMAEVGLLTEDARVELIEGEIIDMAPIGSRHAAAVDRLAQLLQRSVGPRATVRVQGPIRLSASSEPQPDVALLKPRDDFYATKHPTGQDTLLLIEVSDTTFRYDREVKVPLYARHGVPEVWIIDLKNRHVHCFRVPNGGEYTDVSLSGEPAEIELSALPGVMIDLSGVLGA